MAIVLPAFTTSAVITSATLISQTDEQLNILMTDVKNYVQDNYNVILSSLSSDAAEIVDILDEKLTMFERVYLGAYNADPLLDNEGFPLVIGAMYFNTSGTVLKVYSGSAWISAITLDVFTKGEVQNSLPAIGLDTSLNNTPNVGQMTWNQDDYTANLGMPFGVTQQVGQELYMTVKNTSGHLLSQAKPVMATGTIGNSSRILCDYYDTLQASARKLIGVTTHDIADGADGLVVTFGKIHNIDTTGSGYSETWANGDILYVSSTVLGGLTNIQPAYGTLSMPIGYVIHAHTNGSIFVRIQAQDENALVNTIDSKLALKAPLASPVFTGTVTAPTFSGALNGNATTATTATNVAWSGVTSKPTTLQGYGIVPEEMPSNIDLDTKTTTALFSQGTNSEATTALKYPVSSAGLLEVFAYSSMIHQRYWVYNSDDIYYRAKYSTGAWSAWVKGANVNDSITGNAATATKLQTARTIDLTGDVTGSVNFDGSGNVSITTAVQPTIYTKEDVLGAVGNIMSPLLDLPLKNNLTMKAGVGSTAFTRASTATYIDRYGILKTADIDEPRFEKEGYLNEGASTNLVTNSNTFTHPEWGNATNTLVGGYSSPDGTNNATLVTTVNQDSCAIFKSVVFSANTATVSIFAKAGTSSSLTLRFIGYDTNLVCQFNLANKTVSHTNGKITELGEGWFRCSLTITLIGTDLDGQVYCYVATNAGTNYNSDIGNSMYIYGFQAEASPFTTSYIPTTSSTVTRSADVLQVTRENNFPNAENNVDGYSVTFTYDSLGIRAANQFLWSLYVNGQNYVAGYLATTSNSLRSYVAKDGVGVSNSVIPVNPLGSNKVVQTQSNAILKQYINNTLVDTDANTLGTLGGVTNSLTNITIGGVSGISTANLFGHISNFKVYDFELTPVEVALA